MGRFNSTFTTTPATSGITTITMNNGQPTIAKPEPKPEPKPEHHAVVSPSTVGTKSNAKKHEYVAPKDAIEAKQRIEAAMAKNTVIIDSKEGEDPVTFRGATYGLKDCFRMLGGDFDKTNSLWFVPRAAWLDPTTATATKSDAMLRKEKDEADREAAIQQRIQEAIEADRKLRPAATPEGMITIEEAKKMATTAVQFAFSRLIAIPREQLAEYVDQVFSTRK